MMPTPTPGSYRRPPRLRGQGKTSFIDGLVTPFQSKETTDAYSGILLDTPRYSEIITPPVEPLSIREQLAYVNASDEVQPFVGPQYNRNTSVGRGKRSGVASQSLQRRAVVSGLSQRPPSSSGGATSRFRPPSRAQRAVQQAKKNVSRSQRLTSGSQTARPHTSQALSRAVGRRTAPHASMSLREKFLAVPRELGGGSADPTRRSVRRKRGKGGNGKKPMSATMGPRSPLSNSVRRTRMEWSQVMPSPTSPFNFSAGDSTVRSTSPRSPRQAQFRVKPAPSASPRGSGGGGRGPSVGSAHPAMRHTKLGLANVATRNDTVVSNHYTTSSSEHTHTSARQLCFQPHRMHPPPFMNVPKRWTRSTVQSLDHASAGVGGDTAQDTHPLKRPAMTMQQKILVGGRIKDYSERARACHRAGRYRSEANAFFCMGVLYDNIQEHARAIKCYERFLGVLQGASDQFAEALAHNCIGVSMQLRGPRWYKHALFHHGRHLQLALDYSGQFIARTNIGLLHNTKYLDNTSEAHASHEHALRCAEAMQSEAARSIALGNLGLTALHDKHVGNEDAEKYIAEHYDLSARSKDKEGRAVASDMLGRIAQEQGDYEKAADFFRESYDLQRDQGRAESLARINLGVALGELSVQHFMQSEVPALFGSTSRPLSAVQ